MHYAAVYFLDSLDHKKANNRSSCLTKENKNSKSSDWIVFSWFWVLVTMDDTSLVLSLWWVVFWQYSFRKAEIQISISQIYFYCSILYPQKIIIQLIYNQVEKLNSRFPSRTSHRFSNIYGKMLYINMSKIVIFVMPMILYSLHIYVNRYNKTWRFNFILGNH